jgi:hypothetical protein
MIEWFFSLPTDVSLLIAAGIGAIVGAFSSWFGEILTPEDLV